MISVAGPIVGDEEKKAVLDVLDSGMLAQGVKVTELEDAFTNFCGTKYAVAVNSGTAALHTALFSVGIRGGDEVITTPFSFIATANPILMQGARPVFVDINEDNFNINSALVDIAITKNSKAILGVDLYGQPYEFDELSSISKKNNLYLIEDACQAIGAKYGGKLAGNLGDVSCFSLYATKNIMSGEGGILTTNDKDIAENAKQFRQHGMIGPYEYAELGYNYRMTDVLAAIGTVQLKKVKKFNAIRQRNAKIFDEGLAGIPGVIIPSRSQNRTHVFHQYTIRVTSQYRHTREELMNILKQNGIGSGIYYPKPLHLYPHIARLGYKMGDFPVAEKVSQEVLSLPVHAKVSLSDVKKIVDVIRENS